MAGPAQSFAEREAGWAPLRLRLDQALDAAATIRGDATGWIFEDDAVTFAAMRDGARRVAGALARSGIGRGDTVAIWLPNEVAWAHAIFACSLLGARLAAINTRSKADEAGHVLSNSGAKALIFRPAFLNIDYGALLEGVDPQFSAGALAALDERARATPHICRIERGRPGAPVPLASLSGSFDVPENRAAPEDEAILVQYTSGSTSLPKGALLSHVHVLNFGHHVAERMGVRPGEAFLNTQPLYHIGGSCSSLCVPITQGCIMVMPEYYEPGRVLELIARHRCVARTGMSTMYVREMQHPRFHTFDLSSLRAGWTIGPPALLDKIRAEFPIEGMIQLYGMSEGGATCGALDEPWAIRRVSAGRPYPGTFFSIVDPVTGRDLPAGQTGEIRFAGWARCLGYVGMDAAAAFDEFGRFRSGDLGHLDAAGRVYFDGRLKEMIKPGGENVSALEVEAFLGQHPAVAQVAVFGVPDDDLGEAVVAVIEPVAGSGLTEQALRDFCQGRIANFRIPRYIRFTAAWPMTGSGKILKRVLQEQVTRELRGGAPPAPADSSPVQR